MTKAERERRAVAEHRCPRCRAQEHMRCLAATVEVRRLAHPHPERVALVPDAED